MDLIVESPTVLLLGGQKIPIVLGKAGVKKEKREGDLATPQGIFQIGPIFGHAKKHCFSFKIDYLPLYSDTVAIDDPCSNYYNQIVRESEIVDRDWLTCEKMGQEPLYELGAVIRYNTGEPVRGRGSAIFMHLWRDEKSPTAGCIAMSKENLIRVLTSIDATSRLFTY